MLGAMIGWWVGGLVGARIGRFALWRQNARRAPGQLLMDRQLRIAIEGSPEGDRKRTARIVT
ncbi:hypothetical protein D9X30_5866 [Cupriavidus sp. U2]|nr:hypothetical protein D9X30_5866 [Cupriavidus sp. U2]